MLMTPATYETVYNEPCEYKAALADTPQADKHIAAADLQGTFRREEYHDYRPISRTV